MQEEGSLPSKRSGEGGAKRRSAQAKRGRLGCLLRAPEAEPLRKVWFPCWARSAGDRTSLLLLQWGRRCGQERGRFETQFRR